jgi:hypothetical protein
VRPAFADFAGTTASRTQEQGRHALNACPAYTRSVLSKNKGKASKGSGLVGKGREGPHWLAEESLLLLHCCVDPFRDIARGRIKWQAAKLDNGFDATGVGGGVLWNRGRYDTAAVRATTTGTTLPETHIATSSLPEATSTSSSTPIPTITRCTPHEVLDFISHGPVELLQAPTLDWSTNRPNHQPRI